MEHRAGRGQVKKIGGVEKRVRSLLIRLRAAARKSPGTGRSDGSCSRTDRSLIFGPRPG